MTGNKNKKQKKERVRETVSFFFKHLIPPTDQSNSGKLFCEPAFQILRSGLRARGEIDRDYLLRTQEGKFNFSPIPITLSRLR